MLLVPFAQRLVVDRTDLRVAALLQHLHQVAADEATRAGDDDKIILDMLLPLISHGLATLVCSPVLKASRQARRFCHG